jgi:4-amino-4-deoxy-L-arabinose transferase-like glycosyltransferase
LPPEAADRPREEDSPPDPGGGPRRGLLLAALAAAALLLSFLGSRELRNPDEPRDAETAREAAEGLWTLAPEINGIPFRERPPLYYWMVAAAFRVSGEPSDASAKVASALLGILAVVSCGLLGESLLGRGRGWLPALLLLGTPYFFLEFRTCGTDAGLAAFTALSLACFFTAWTRGSPAWAAAAGAAAGLAFLCKGLLGFGIPAVAAGAWLVAKRDLRAVLRLRLWVSVLVGLAVVAPWLLAVYRQQGAEWLRAFFLDQHLGRIGSSADHFQPPWFYVRFLWAGAPLSLLLLAGLLPGWRRDAPGRDAFLAGALWTGGMLLVLSAIGGKRVVYLLPLLPGAALAAAGVVEAAAAGALGGAGSRLSRFLVAACGWLTLQPPFTRGRDLRVRAGAAALGLAALALGADAVVLAGANRERSGYALAARAVEVAKGRPLVLYRVGEGDIGQFAFALRRRLPVAWTEERLRALLSGGEGVVLTEDVVLERAIRRGDLSGECASSLRRIEEGVANGDRYLLLEWSGGGDPPEPGVPPGGRR